eukprot:767552-Hanusia_phi.AAC.3
MFRKQEVRKKLRRVETQGRREEKSEMRAGKEKGRARLQNKKLRYIRSHRMIKRIGRREADVGMMTAI